MKSILKNFILIALFILTSISVSAQKVINQYEPEATFERGLMLFENKHYASALECFEFYISTADDQNDQNVITAKYYEAVSSLFFRQQQRRDKNHRLCEGKPYKSHGKPRQFLVRQQFVQRKKIS